VSAALQLIFELIDVGLRLSHVDRHLIKLLHLLFVATACSLLLDRVVGRARNRTVLLLAQFGLKECIALFLFSEAIQNLVFADHDIVESLEQTVTLSPDLFADLPIGLRPRLLNNLPPEILTKNSFIRSKTELNECLYLDFRLIMKQHFMLNLLPVKQVINQTDLSQHFFHDESVCCLFSHQ